MHSNRLAFHRSLRRGVTMLVNGDSDDSDADVFEESYSGDLINYVRVGTNALGLPKLQMTEPIHMPGGVETQSDYKEHLDSLNLNLMLYPGFVKARTKCGLTDMIDDLPFLKVPFFRHCDNGDFQFDTSVFASVPGLADLYLEFLSCVDFLPRELQNIVFSYSELVYVGTLMSFYTDLSVSQLWFLRYAPSRAYFGLLSGSLSWSQFKNRMIDIIFDTNTVVLGIGKQDSFGNSSIMPRSEMMTPRVDITDPNVYRYKCNIFSVVSRDEDKFIIQVAYSMTEALYAYTLVTRPRDMHRSRFWFDRFLMPCQLTRRLSEWSVENLFVW